VAEIDAILAHRAEQALLGALLAGASPAAVADVRPADFRDPAHRAIYAALTGQFRRGGPVAGVRAWAARAGGLRVARVAEYAEGLPARCPRPGHLLAYGAMVLQGRRPSGTQPHESGGPARQLAGADAWLSSATGRHARGRAPGTGPPGGERRLAPGVQRLARALAPIVQRLRDQAAPGRGHGEMGDGVVLAHGKTGNVTAAGLQELVLAGLMRHPAEGQALAGRVPPEVFGDGPRRELYTVVRQLIARRLPVDPLIAAWEGRRRDARPAGAAGESAAELALRLGELPALPGTAGHLCRGLLADYELTRAYGRDWPRQQLNWGGRQPGPAAREAPAVVGPATGAATAAQAPARKRVGPVRQDVRPPRPSGPAAGTVPRHG
jgi:hypothetical protein